MGSRNKKHRVRQYQTEDRQLYGMLVRGVRGVRVRGVRVRGVRGVRVRGVRVRGVRGVRVRGVRGEE